MTTCRFIFQKFLDNSFILIYSDFPKYKLFVHTGILLNFFSTRMVTKYQYSAINIIN